MINEYYGPKAAKNTVYIGLAMSILVRERETLLVMRERDKEGRKKEKDRARKRGGERCREKERE